VADGAAPFTGGNGDALCWLGNGAGNAPCANTWPAEATMAAAVSGTIRRRIIKGFLRRGPGKPNVFKKRSRFTVGFFTIPAAA
jgi:hypothetical protein